MRHTRSTMLCLLLGVWPAAAQEPVAAVPTLTVDLETVEPDAPAGLRLDLVAEVVGVPVVLEQVSATSDLALATVRFRSTASVPIAEVSLAVTAVRSREAPQSAVPFRWR